MGASQSARKLTINNEEGVIQISTDLVQRLTHSSRDTSTQVDATTEGQPTDSLKTAIDPDLEPTTPVTPPSPIALPSRGYPVQSYPEYTMTAYKMVQQKEQELQAQDQYWQKRLQNLKMTQEKINKVFEDEYKRAVQEIANAKGKKTIDLDSAIPACCSDKEKVIKCYKENPHEILKCSDAVEQFNYCVDQRRANIIAARC